MNWIQLLSCLAQELVKGPVSEALPKPKALEGEYRGNYDPIRKYNGQGREAISNL